MNLLKKHYTGIILTLTFILYIIIARIGFQIGGVIIGTFLGNMIIIGGIGFIYWIDHFKLHNNYVTPIALKYNKNDIIISYVLILILWIFGQFVFLWVYQTFGDSTYTKNYTDTFNDVSVIVWTLLLTSIVAPIAEELVFRYLLFGRPVHKNNNEPSYLKYIFYHVLSSVLFGLIHGTMLHQIIVVPLGFVLGMLMYKTNRIIFPILGHMLFNNLSIFMSPLLLLYKNYLNNNIVVGAMILIYGILVIGSLGFVIIRKRN